MAKRKRASKGKEIKPAYFVFCEGESEEAYVGHLRNQFKVSVELTPKVEKSNISRKIIDKHLKHRPRHEKDKIFLMYDIDVNGIFEKLQNIEETILLASNPCFEIWYLFHCQNCNKYLSSDDCLKALSRIIPDYKKGYLSPKLIEKLRGLDFAMQNAMAKNEFQNPSTTMPLLINELIKVKR